MTQKQDTRNMTVGNPYRLMIEFAIPIFLSQLFQQLYNSVDSLIVGNFLGKEALAAVSSSGNLIFLLSSFFIGTSMGSGVVISRYFGAGNQENVTKAIHTNVAFGVVASIILTIVGVIATPSLLRMMGTDPSVLPNSIIYFRYYFMGISTIIMYNIFKSILNAVGDSKRPLYYLIFSSVLNILLDLLFIGVFHYGVASAAIATVISQGVSAVLCFIHLLQKGTVYQLVPSKVRFHKDMLKEIITYGFPTGIQNSVIGFANVIVQTNINSFGANAMAGYGSYSKIEGFAFLPITCFSMALTTFISQNLGAKEYSRAKVGAKFGIIASIAIAELIGVVIFVFAPILIGLFSKDVDVIQFGVNQVHVVALFYFLLSFSHCIAAICRGAGKAVVPMVIMLLVWCVLRIVYITIMMHFVHEIKYIYTAYPLTWSISSVIYYIYYKKSDWIHGFEQI